jgi:hypothetical protein
LPTAGSSRLYPAALSPWRDRHHLFPGYDPFMGSRRNLAVT